MEDMNFEPKMLGQVRPSSTVAEQIYSPERAGKLRGFYITNTTDSTVTASIFINNEGTTYDESTAILWDTIIPAGEPVEVEMIDGLVLNNPSASVGVKSSSGNALTFTLWGAESSLR